MDLLRKGKRESDEQEKRQLDEHRKLAAQVNDSTPMRLADAARVAFPDGSMTAAGLRTEARRGRLAIMRVAGKDYTTLADLRDMMQQCRVTPKARYSGSSRNGATLPGTPLTPEYIELSTAAAMAALEATILAARKKPLPTTSTPSTAGRSRRASAPPHRSRSKVD